MAFLKGLKKFWAGKKSKEKVDIELKAETVEDKRKREFEAYLAKKVEKWMARGYDKIGAEKKAWKEIEKQIEKGRLKGTPVVCARCNRYGVNHASGGFVKSVDAQGNISYSHQNPNCKEA